MHGLQTPKGSFCSRWFWVHGGVGVWWNAWAAACSLISFFSVRLCSACPQPWCLVHTGTAHRSSQGALQWDHHAVRTVCTTRAANHSKLPTFHEIQGWKQRGVALLSASTSWSSLSIASGLALNCPMVKSAPRMAPEWGWRVSRACVRVGCCCISKCPLF